jgi:Flp pilus assembly pilin Flp
MKSTGDIRAARMRRGQCLEDQTGQSLVEYALIIALIALAAIVALGFLSGKITGLFSKAGNSVNGVAVAEGSGTGGPPPPTPPGAPSSIVLANGGGASNAYINQANEGAVDVTVNLPAGSFGAGFTLTLSLSDGSGPAINLGPVSASSAAVNFNNIDTSPTLSDGTITFTATITGPGGSTPGTANYTRDTVDPSTSNSCTDVEPDVAPAVPGSTSYISCTGGDSSLANGTISLTIYRGISGFLVCGLNSQGTVTINANGSGNWSNATLGPYQTTPNSNDSYCGRATPTDVAGNTGSSNDDSVFDLD